MSGLDYQIEHNLLSHAYIFESPNDKYNLEYSKEFASKIFEDKGIYIENNLNPDLYIINKENDIIDIESIRAMIKDIAHKPENKLIKIYIVHNAHNMRTEGYNAILKTVEELKEYNIVIFTTTNRNLLLPTIRSRSQIINLNAKKIKRDVDYDKLSKIIAEVYRGNIGYYYQNKSFFENYKNDRFTIVDACIDIFQEIVNYKYNKNLIIEDVNFNIRKLESISLDNLEEIINLLYTIKTGFKNNINYELALEELIYSIYKGGQI